MNKDNLKSTQFNALRIKDLSKNKPVKKINNEQELDDFFNEDE